jgi:AcrR family transcriptional regulator
VGKELGVEAMSLYHHIAGKEALLDALVDRIFAGIELPGPGEDWRVGMRRRAASARAQLAAHPWALGLIESRPAPGPALLRHHDAVIGCLRRGGFSVADAAHAFSVIDSYLYGFVLTEVSLPFDSAEELAAVGEGMAADLAGGAYPYFAELVSEYVSRPDYSYDAEFEYGLELILDGLERHA